VSFNNLDTLRERRLFLQRHVSRHKNGIAVEGLLGAGQSNILRVDCNANVLLGYRVEKGEIICRPKNTVINGNVYTVLRGV